MLRLHLNMKERGKQVWMEVWMRALASQNWTSEKLCVSQKWVCTSIAAAVCQTQVKHAGGLAHADGVMDFKTQHLGPWSITHSVTGGLRVHSHGRHPFQTSFSHWNLFPYECSSLIKANCGNYEFDKVDQKHVEEQVSPSV